MTARLKSQMSFLDEIEKLKVIYRRNRTVDGARFENSAEHSWHVALMAIVLFEHADTKSLDLLKIVTMLLIHDVVEIYAGDTWAYDTAAKQSQASREGEAAERLFSLLPDDQARGFRDLWKEFEERKTANAAFAGAVDALQPLSNHLCSGAVSADYEPISQTQVIERKRYISESSQVLWDLAQEIIRKSAAHGLYR